ncbi:MAG: tetratricopeptide repeat protein [bacterium]|nr:tetratricopeptide repeat protein [bacterium]
MNRSRYAGWICLLLFFSGCATTQPQITLRPVPQKRTPHPEALSYFIHAKVAEMTGRREAAIQALYAAVGLDSTSAILYGSLARNLNARRRYTESVEHARQAVQLDPQSIEHRWLLYRALMQGPKDTIQAIVHLKALAHKTPRPLRAYDQLMQIYSNLGQRDSVLAVLARIETLPGLNIEGKLRAAENYQIFEAPQKSEGLYRNILRGNPKEVRAWVALGNSVLSRKDTLQSIRIFRNGLSQFQNQLTRQNSQLWGQLLRVYNHSDAHLQDLLSETPFDTLLVQNLGTAFYDLASGDRSGQNLEGRARLFNNAGHIFNRLIQALPNRSDLIQRKARILLHMGQFAESRDAFRQAHNIQQKPEYVFGIGLTYLNEGNLQDALDIFTELYKLAPINWPFYLDMVSNLARIYIDLGQMEDARAVYARAANDVPDEPRYPYELARTYIFERKWEKAIPILKPLEQSTENDAALFPVVLFDLGTSLERAGQFDESVDIFRRLLAVQPENGQALNYLGYMFAEKGVHLNEAESYLERALKLEPQSPYYLDSLGWVYYRQERFQEALEYLERALDIEETTYNELPPESPARKSRHENLSVIHDHVGDAARALGKLGIARPHWEQALKFDPESQEIRQKLQPQSKFTDKPVKTQ